MSLTDTCEVRDYVEDVDGVRVVRQQNEASNVELARRGGSDRWGGIVASGELAPYSIVWVNTCGGEWLQPGV